MTTNKRTDSKPLPPEDRPRPGPLPTEGEGVRDVGKRALNDVRGPQKDTDQSGYNRQRDGAPTDAPTRRSGKNEGTDDR
jgi:hypothetical protein